MRWVMPAIYTVCAIIFALALVRFFFPPQISINAELLPPDQGAVIRVIAVDIDANQTVNPNTVRDGTDSFLVVKANSPALGEQAKAQPAGKVFVFNGAKSLFAVDKNADGRLDSSDPIFADLQIATLRRFSSDTIYTPLDRAGIISIYFNSEYVQQVRQGKTVAEGSAIGFAIMSDSSRRTLRVTTLPLSDLNR